MKKSYLLLLLLLAPIFAHAAIIDDVRDPKNPLKLEPKAWADLIAYQKDLQNSSKLDLQIRARGLLLRAEGVCTVSAGMVGLETIVDSIPFLDLASVGVALKAQYDKEKDTEIALVAAIGGGVVSSALGSLKFLPNGTYHLFKRDFDWKNYYHMAKVSYTPTALIAKNLFSNNSLCNFTLIKEQMIIDELGKRGERAKQAAVNHDRQQMKSGRSPAYVEDVAHGADYCSTKGDKAD